MRSTARGATLRKPTVERHLTAEPISPELVLVDPDLAAGARSALPERPWPAPVRIEPPTPSRARGGGLLSGLLWPLGFGLMLAVVIFGLSLISTNDRPTFAAEGNSAPSAVPPPAPAPPAPPDDQPQPSAPSAARPPAPAAPRTATRPRTPQAAPKPPRPARLKFSPARLFSWAPRARTAYYQVVFLRNGRPFYRTRARGPRLRLPNKVRFAAGRYRWTVRSAVATGRGVRLSSPIVDSTFRISGD
jgi:hypothetical protein